MQGKRTAGGADLPDTARVAVADVKRLFAAQKGFLDNFFQKVSLEGSVFRVCWVGVWVGDWTDAKPSSHRAHLHPHDWHSPRAGRAGQHYASRARPSAL